MVPQHGTVVGTATVSVVAGGGTNVGMSLSEGATLVVEGDYDGPLVMSDSGKVVVQGGSLSFPANFYTFGDGTSVQVTSGTVDLGTSSFDGTAANFWQISGGSMIASSGSCMSFVCVCACGGTVSRSLSRFEGSRFSLSPWSRTASPAFSLVDHTSHPPCHGAGSHYSSGDAEWLRQPCWADRRHRGHSGRPGDGVRFPVSWVYFEHVGGYYLEGDS